MTGKFCRECGTKLVPKELENEGIVPYCPNCGQYRFPQYNVAVIMIVVNESTGEILLIQQYGRKNNILVAGYVSKGENAENAVVREVMEETGLKVVDMNFNKSEYFEKTNTLMLNYSCRVEDESLAHLNKGEVDKAQWFTHEQACENIKPDSLAQKFLFHYLGK